MGLPTGPALKRTYSGTGVTMMKSMTAVRMDAKWTRLEDPSRSISP
jgi:hypothetical protein